MQKLSQKESRDPLSEFWYRPNISGTAETRDFNFGKRLMQMQNYAKRCHGGVM